MGKERRGVEARGGSIRITFTFKGERCRETLRIPPTAKNLQFAENKHGQILTEIALGTFDYGAHFPDSIRAKLGRAKNTATFSKRVQLWISTRTISDTTRRAYLRYASEYVDKHELGLRPIAGIMASELDRWRADLAAKFRPKTVNNALILVRGAFSQAHADGVIKADPAARLQNVKNPKRTHADPFDPDELQRLHAVMDDPHRNLIEFWWNTGLRHGEAFGLRWEDVDWRKSVIHVQRAIVAGKLVPTKDAEDRFVHMGPRAVKALKAQRTLTELAGEWVFLNPDTGQHWLTHKEIQKKFARWCRKAKVRPRPPKQLRHTYASMALSAGEPALFVMNQLGHSSLVMLERHYAKWMPRANERAGAGFDVLAAKAGA